LLTASLSATARCCRSLAAGAAFVLASAGALAQTLPAAGSGTTPVPGTRAAATRAAANSAANTPANGAADGAADGAAIAAAKPEPPPAPCESADADNVTGDPNSGMASESFASQRVVQRPTPATRIACALKKGRRAAALKIADDFLAQHPRDAQVRFLRAVILGDLSRPDEASAVLESLIEDFPELAEPYNNLAVIRANQGDLATAEHYLQQSIAAAPTYVTARENLGDLYISLAAATYDGALRLAPENTVVRRKLTLARELGNKLHAAP
jgi:Flp pilus assembly protein TadD